MSAFIDGHCHLALLPADSLEAILARSEAAGVSAWVMGGVSPADWRRQDAVALSRPGRILKSVGLHPAWVVSRAGAPDEIASALAELEERIQAPDVILGELGLDYFSHANRAAREVQLAVFSRQLELARASGRPVILHAVRAQGAVLGLLKSHGKGLTGLVHAFSGSLEVLREYLDRGYSISVGAGVTRPGYAALKKALASIPLDRLILESDAPDGMAEPAGLIQVAQAAASLRGESAGALLEASAANLRSLFKWKI